MAKTTAPKKRTVAKTAPKTSATTKAAPKRIDLRDAEVAAVMDKTANLGFQPAVQLLAESIKRQTAYTGRNRIENIARLAVEIVRLAGEISGPVKKATPEPIRAAGVDSSWDAEIESLVFKFHVGRQPGPTTVIVHRPDEGDAEDLQAAAQQAEDAYRRFEEGDEEEGDEVE